MKLLRSTAVIGAMTGLSRVLGFVREILIAAVLGAGPIADAFFVALRFPNLFRRVLAEGAFNAAFVPLYAGRLEEGPDEREAAANAADFASETFSVLVTALIALVAVCVAGMPWLMMALAPGYADDPAWMDRAVLMTQITMPYIAFMSLMAMFGGVLNAHHRFAAFSFAPVLLNVVLVAILLRPPDGAWPTAVALCVGVAVAGVLQCALVFWGMNRQLRRSGVALRLRLPRLSPGVKRVFALGVPGAIAAGVTQINIVVSQMIASLQESAVSWLAFADRLYQLPLGMIGIAMGVALLPALTRTLKAGNVDGGRDTINRALEIAAFFTLPAAVALAIAPAFWVQGLFERGAFDAVDTAATASAVFVFALGLPAFIAAKVFAPGYFAREDTKTPMRYALISAGLNIVLGVALFFTVGFVGLAAATSLAGWANAALLCRGLMRDGVFQPDRRLATRLIGLSAAAATMGAGLWFALPYAQARVSGSLLSDIGVCLALALAGLVVYALAAFVTRGVSVRDVRAALSKR